MRVDRLVSWLHISPLLGVMVRIDQGERGMVHVSDIAWNRAANDVLGKYHKGQSVRVKLLSVDVEKQRISLGIKQLQAKPGIS